MSFVLDMRSAKDGGCNAATALSLEKKSASAGGRLNRMAFIDKGVKHEIHILAGRHNEVIEHFKYGRRGELAKFPKRGELICRLLS